MSSPEHGQVSADAAGVETRSPRSRRTLRIAGVLLAIVGLAFANAACQPVDPVRDAIATHWTYNTACAERIVQRESGFNPDAVNRYSGATGLFQLMPLHASWIKAELGYDFTEMKDPYKNSEAAKRLSTKAYLAYGDGWQPWRGYILRGGGCPF